MGQRHAQWCISGLGLAETVELAFWSMDTMALLFAEMAPRLTRWLSGPFFRNVIATPSRLIEAIGFEGQI